ncbi:hypothetical protein IPC1135_29640 [Pseudomonas aeruginosa]|uniref:hypothetical protein n=1 Tax=Pseudomonas aeruginosa TaxID=287 RepID=UPI000FC416BF|nr:hypothetical protein [Pseudomonas aeruginosa]RUE86334.1 hypothetical protein IPC1135_29640 [Pseudomonas aeruginosa]
MLYLFLCTLMLILCIAEFHRQMLGLIGHGHRLSPVRGIGSFLIAGAFCAPVLTLMMSILLGVESISNEQSRITVNLLLAASLASLGLFVFDFNKAWASKSFGFWATGRLAILLMAGVVGSMSAYKHLEFFSVKDAGWVSVGTLRELVQLNDMKDCGAAIALVQYREAGPLAYRCPTTILINSMSGEPFTPWPDYVEGSSDQLAAAIQTIKDRTLKPEQTE